MADRLPFTYTGADFYALCSDAMLKAVTRQAANVDAKIHAINSDPSTKHAISTAYFFDHKATAEDIAVMVTESDFIAAHEELIPSVSAGELAHYEKVRASFEGDKDDHAKKNGISSGAAGAGLNQSDASQYPVKIPVRGKEKTSKGKGKAVATYSDEEDDDDDEGMNMSKDKGKGKAVMGFQESTASDDEGLY